MQTEHPQQSNEVWLYSSLPFMLSLLIITAVHMYTHAEISLTLLLTLMLALTFILRNSCKVKQNQLVPKDFSGKVGSDDVPTACLTNVTGRCISSCRVSRSQRGWFSSLLLKDEHHGDHATDEEKLASSVKPDKDGSSEYSWSVEIDFNVAHVCMSEGQPAAGRTWDNNERLSCFLAQWQAVLHRDQITGWWSLDSVVLASLDQYWAENLSLPYKDSTNH